MKKLLIFVMILGITSAASASLSFEVSSGFAMPGETLSVKILMDAPGGVNSVASIIGYYASPIATLTVTPGDDVVPGLDSINPLSAPYVGYFQTLMGTVAPGGFAAGDHILTAHLTISDTITMGDAYTINIWDENWSNPATDLWDSFIFAIIPEPMTISLLAVGGVLMRRRK